MGISRKLPTTDEGRKAALLTANTKNEATAAGARHLSAPTQARLAAIVTSFINAMQERGIALSGQSSKTTEETEAKTATHKYVSHFIQVFNLGVSRGKYPASERAFFQLPINSDALPKLVTEQEILDWGLNIITGDAARITAGGTAMSNPTAAEVALAVEAFALLNSEQSALKGAYDAAQEALATLRPEADAVIKKVWDETETFYNEEAPPSMRRKCREWGVVYVSTTELTFNFTVTNSANSSAIGNATITLTQTGNQHNTDAAGLATIVSSIADLATFTFEHADYITQTLTLVLPSDQTTYNNSISMVHV